MFGPFWGEEGGGWVGGSGGFLKFFDRQRQSYTISMEFEMLRCFNNNYIKNWKTVVESIFNTVY